MSQQQPQRPQDHQDQPIKYGDMFAVEGELADKPVAPEDAKMMQTAETAMLGQTQKGGLAATLQSAAQRNERAGFVGHQDVSAPAAEEGVRITESNLPGQRIYTESVAGQVIGHYSQPTDDYEETTNQPGPVLAGGSNKIAAGDPITIGEALEAAALSAGDVSVEWSDAAAIQAAEVRASGRTNITPGGVAAAAQSAATLNARLPDEAPKTTLGDLLTDASSKLPSDKAATRRDAEGVMAAELRNDPNLSTRAGGVAASLAAAARINQKPT